jgi:UDP-N-acetylmuramyl pentapeptide phosphotransferase/UDP-N-acetylglucosamine-1-phosphate transferase
MIFQTLFIILLLAIFSYMVVIWIRRAAVQRHILDYPNERSSHSVPTPRGGGLAIAGLVIGIVLVYGIDNGFDGQSLAFVIAGILIAWLGWRDDVHHLPARVRFGVQALAVVIAMLGLGYFRSVTIPLLGEWQLGWFGIPITFLWILGLINAYNFMDGLDGFAGGVALAASLGWMLLSFPGGGLENSLAFWIALGIAAGSLGFLGHNWSPARIFMGDVGSTFLGFAFAVLPLLSAGQGGDALMFGTAILWTFIMDAGVTFLRRLAKHEDVLAAHRTHLYQRLVISGIKPAVVSLLFILLTLLGAGLSLAWARGQRLVAPLIILGLPLIWILLSLYTARRERAG